MPKQTLKSKSKKMAQNFREYVKGSKDKVESQIKKKISNSRTTMNNYFKSIHQLERCMIEFHKELNSVRGKLKRFEKRFNPEYLEKTFHDFLKKKMIVKLEYKSNEIIAYTGKIHISNYGKSYYVGKFKITIGLDGNITMDNLDNSNDMYDHPHINEGSPCFGSISTKIPKMIAQGDYINLLVILYNFLISYNEDNCYCNLEDIWGE